MHIGDEFAYGVSRTLSTPGGDAPTCHVFRNFKYNWKVLV